MMKSILNVQFHQGFTPEFTPKSVVKLVAKVAILVLATPLTFVLFSSGFKGRIVDWLTNDWMRESCWNVWDSFYSQYKEKLNDNLNLSKDDFCEKYKLEPCQYEYLKCNICELLELNNLEFGEFFRSFPKTATYFSNIFSSDKVCDDKKISYYIRLVFLWRVSQCDIYSKSNKELKNYESVFGDDLNEAKEIAEDHIAKSLHK